MPVNQAPMSFSRRALVASFLVVPSLAAALIVGCGDDDNGSVPKPDGGVADASVPETSPPDVTVVDAGPDAAVVARGKYLVDHVAACGDCHTPRLQNGAPDMSRYLAGVDCFVDANGPEDAGCLSSANLTNHPTGLANASDAEIKTMFLDGKRPDGRFLVSVMPYYVLHNMKAEDADAIVAYLRTLPGVEHVVRPNEAPFNVVPAAATPIDPATIPAADGGAAENGRYLATMVGVCLECHTPELPIGSPTPIDMTKPFGGGREFPAAALGLPSPPFPETIRSSNITPHATGINGWSTADIVRVIKQGKDQSDAGVCPPMPAGPMGAFGGLTDQDALDIATYISGLPPVNNAIQGGNGSCQAP